MDKNNGLLNTIIYLILIALITFYGLILYKVNEIEKYIKVHDGIQISKEFEYIKDFADRNIEVFVWYSTLLFAGIAIISAFILRLEFNRSLDSIRDHFSTSSEEARRNYDKHEEELNSLKNDLLQTEYILLATSATLFNKLEEYNWHTYFSFISLSKAYKSLFRKDTEQVRDSIVRLKINIESGIEKLESGCEQIFTLSNQSELMKNCPEEERAEVMNLVLMYNNKCVGLIS